MRTTLICLLIFIVLSWTRSWGQEPEKTDLLDNYIREGIENNLVLQQKNISLDKALIALKTAKSLFFPMIEVQVGYQTAEGGRDIPLPLGDLLNDVYSTLNQLTGRQNFPLLENQTIQFLPENYYDARVRTSIPILNTDLYYNKKISSQQAVLQEYEVEIYRRELVKSIKVAYYSYLSALKALDIYEASLHLAEEGKRVNEKLLEKGKGLPAYVLRANSEIASVRSQLTAARQQVDNALLYFNSLLNHPADAPIDTGYRVEAAMVRANQSLSRETAISLREELMALEQAVRLNETTVNMKKSFWVPKLNGFLDLGSQAEDWKYNGNSRYYLAGLQLNIPVFEGNRNRHEIRQARLNVEDARLNRENVRLQLDVRARVARNNLAAAWESYRSSQTQLEAADSYQRLIERGYRAGANSYIETVDARSQLTSARMALIIDQYRVLQAAAELERETASYRFERNREPGAGRPEAGNRDLTGIFGQ